MFAVTITPSSFGLSGEPGSDAVTTCTLGAFRAIDRRKRFYAEYFLAVLGVIVADDDQRESSILQILVKLRDVVNDEMRRRERARRGSTRQVEEQFAAPSGRPYAVRLGHAFAAA
jgi:hypothetical protein